VDTGPRPEIETPPPAETAKTDTTKGNAAKPDAAKGDKLPAPDMPNDGVAKPKTDGQKQGGGDAAKIGADTFNNGKTSASTDANEKDAPKSETK
jgi:hypothetical protein